MFKIKFIGFILSVLFLFFLGCSTVGSLLQSSNIQNPALEFKEVNITGLSFTDINLVFNIGIVNPNPIGIKLDGFDYNLSLNNYQFLKGKHDEKLELKAKDETTIQFPLSLNFKDIVYSIQSLSSKDSTSYTLECGFFFNVPILGNKRIPLKKSGDLPLIKIPSLKLHSLRLNKINLTTADLLLEVEVDNPNNLPLSLGRLNYQLDMNNNNWISGSANLKQELEKKELYLLKLPFKLKFLDLGSSIYQLIKGNTDFEYHLKGDINVRSDKYFLKDSNLPFNLSGMVNLQK